MFKLLSILAIILASTHEAAALEFPDPKDPASWTNEDIEALSFFSQMEKSGKLKLGQGYCIDYSPGKDGEGGSFKILLNSNSFFDTAKCNLKPGAKASMDQVNGLISEFDKYQDAIYKKYYAGSEQHFDRSLNITGFADAQTVKGDHLTEQVTGCPGGYKDNQGLSQDRADKIKSKIGSFDASRIKTDAFATPPVDGVKNDCQTRRSVLLDYQHSFHTHLENTPGFYQPSFQMTKHQGDLQQAMQAEAIRQMFKDAEAKSKDKKYVPRKPYTTPALAKNALKSETPEQILDNEKSESVDLILANYYSKGAKKYDKDGYKKLKEYVYYYEKYYLKINPTIPKDFDKSDIAMMNSRMENFDKHLSKRPQDVMKIINFGNIMNSQPYQNLVFSDSAKRGVFGGGNPTNTMREFSMDALLPKVVQGSKCEPGVKGNIIKFKPPSQTCNGKVHNGYICTACCNGYTYDDASGHGKFNDRRNYANIGPGPTTKDNDAFDDKMNALKTKQLEAEKFPVYGSFFIPQMMEIPGCSGCGCLKDPDLAAKLKTAKTTSVTELSQTQVMSGESCYCSMPIAPSCGFSPNGAIDEDGAGNQKKLFFYNSCSQDNPFIEVDALDDKKNEKNKNAIFGELMSGVDCSLKQTQNSPPQAACGNGLEETVNRLEAYSCAKQGYRIPTKSNASADVRADCN